nr:MAG TPA: hypothetical protein [Caudoviricetes sp.]
MYYLRLIYYVGFLSSIRHTSWAIKVSRYYESNTKNLLLPVQLCISNY